jgi:hypothetical protein
MPNTNNRVLGRLGARELSSEEVERATSGSAHGAQHTNVITFNPYTHQMDGDGT